MGLNVSIKQQGELYDEPILAVENPTATDRGECVAIIVGKRQYMPRFALLNSGTIQELPLSLFTTPDGITIDLETMSPDNAIIQCKHPEEEQTGTLSL